MTVAEILADADCMTAGEMVRALRGVPEDTKLVFVSNYGDYGHTEQIHFLKSMDSMDYTERLYKTAYSDSGLAIGNVADGEEAETQPILVIRS